MSPGQRDDDLLEVLHALRDADATETAPPHVERAVLAAWDAVRRRPAAVLTNERSHRHGMVIRVAGAIAASVMLGVSLTQLGGRLRTAGDVAGDAPATVVLVGEPILRGEPIRVVRMRMPASTLAALGVRATAGDVADAVDVDVIVGEDGVARAIRVGM